MSDPEGLAELRRELAEKERAYESTLAEVDARARLPESGPHANGRPRHLDPRVAGALDLAAAEQAHHEAHMRELAAALVRYMQAVLPLIDAGDRVMSAEVTLGSERALEALDRSLEAGRRPAPVAKSEVSHR